MRYFKKPNNISGITLIEAIISWGISLLLISAIYSIYSSGYELWETKRCQADLQGQARLSLEQMINELKGATRTSTQNPSPNLNIPSTPNNKDIQFYLPKDKDGNGLITDANGDIEWDTSNQIKYQYIPGQKELRRLEKGEQTTLARDATDVQFIDASIDSQLYLNELRIILTSNKTTPRGKTITTTLTSNVRLRN